MTEAAIERTLAINLSPSKHKIFKAKKDKRSLHSICSYRVTSIDVPSLSLLYHLSIDVSPLVQLICSSHSLGYTICTCYTLSSSYELWPSSPNPPIMQTSTHFPLSSIYSTQHTTHIYKQMYIPHYI